MSAADHVAETTSSQRLAADPSLSAFVSANAGSGKTRVLTNRVARLLLNDADPATILCITFTKAAAAEMADRLFALLGAWALADNGRLQKELAELDGDARIRSAGDLARARRLFAGALETPGGLKIQTIHSFCESVLKRFPLEAGVPPGFAVIEEMESGELKRAGIDRVAATARGEVADAFAHLLSRISGMALRELLEDAIGKRRNFARAEKIGWDALAGEIAETLKARAGENAPYRKLIELIRTFDLEQLKELMLAGSATTQKAAAQIDAFRAAVDDKSRFDAISQIFLKADLTPRIDVISKKIAANNPDFANAISQLQSEIIAAIDRIRAAEALEDTRAFYTVIEQCFAEYDAMKSARAALDFDDLIAKTRTLLQAEGGAGWVLYKLDMGLAHILLDEAQDTGPDAWDVIEAPLDEFFSGHGAREQPRTFFAVGDQKQSIYSFQGADAALFSRKEADLGKKIGAAQAYKNVPLKASFRSTAPVLRFVDALFAREEVIENVSNERTLRHHCTREGEAGFVELWPLVKRSEREKPNPWDAPLNATPPDSPPKRLATEIASLIAGWLENRESLQSQDRPIEPGDILVLVQSRGGRSKNALFSEMIRALGAAKVPVAGADKIKLMEDQGVLDLASYARAVLYEGDDLSLAEILRSPFFNISEESLYDLAANRTKARLWNALRERHTERAEWARAFDEISAARTLALKEGAAAFFTNILETGAPSGWRRLGERLGLPSREPIEEFLRQAHDFEMRHPRSLRLFLDAIVTSGAEISREASESGPTVRVMTVHKAKGLEARIVFLLDAHRPAQTGMIGSLISIPGPQGDDLPVIALGDAKDAFALTTARDDKKRLVRDEYRRLLYVAATRAKDRLYICGCESGKADPHKKAPPEKSWHALAEDAFNDLGDAVADAGERLDGRARRLAEPQTVAIRKETRDAQDLAGAEPHDCLTRSVERESLPRRLSPSQLLTHGDGDAAYSPARSEDAFLRGRILHRLLEILPGIDPANRLVAADRLLAHHGAGFSAEALSEMRMEAFRVLEDPRFAEVFAPGSLAEAAIGGRPAGAMSGLILSGQIDRLAVLEDRVLVVDYKTNRPPPKKLGDVPPAYLVQMAAYRGLLQEIYPGRKIECALLWTYDARLMVLTDEALDRTVASAMTLA
jgi:ATP-dependent helicase/nuclease subunit A